MPEGIWYEEKNSIYPYIHLSFQVKQILHQEKSPYQFIEVIDTTQFGKMLFLDKTVMLSEADEFAYHEMLVHPAMVVHPDPKKILIIGGGDGGTIREILKYEVNEIILVDIDKRVIEVCRQYFPDMSKGFDDPRVKVRNEDGAQYVKKEAGKFDIIFIDSTDPIGPGARLVENEFLKDGVNLLTPQGIWVAQTESPFYNQDFIKQYTNDLKSFLPIVNLYLTDVPTYGGVWCYTYASHKINPLHYQHKPPPGLKYYSRDVHTAAFSLPEYIKDFLSP